MPRDASAAAAWLAAAAAGLTAAAAAAVANGAADLCGPPPKVRWGRPARW